MIDSADYSLVEDDFGSTIIQNNSILIQNIKTKECSFIELSEDIRNQLGMTETDETETGETASKESPVSSPKDDKIWTRSNIEIFISKVKEYDSEFDKGIKKNVWIKISKELMNMNINISESQCHSKWKSLIRTYKTILLNNTTSGQKRRNWEYYDKIHEIMFKKPEINPPAVCSSISGFSQNIDPHSNEASTSSTSKSDCEEFNDYESDFSKKRKQKMNKADIRHKEKMSRIDKFNDLFEKMIEKM